MPAHQPRHHGARRLALLLGPLISAGCARDPAPPSAPPPPACADFNVVLISIDTLRADHLGCYGRAAARTPNIDRLAAGGVRFAQCISSAPITLPSHATILTGQYPFVHGARDNGTFVISPDSETLAEHFQRRGYATGAAVAAYVLNREFGVDQGFDAFFDVRSTPAGEHRAELPGDVIASTAIKWLETVRDRRFFLFAHFFDPHQPYTAPPGYRRMFPEDGYSAEIAFTDAQVGRLLQAIESHGLADRTLILLTSDHGEGLGEHGESTHACFVYDTTLHVPLIIAAPGAIPGGAVVTEQVRTVDLASTILTLTGAPTPSGPGVPLLEATHGTPRAAPRPAYAESFYARFAFGFSQLRAWREDGWKLIHAPAPELYQVAPDHDPAELHNLFAHEPARVEALQDRLRALLAAAPVAARAAAGAGDAATLRSLGYLGGGGTLDAAAEIDLFEPAGPNPADFVETIEATIRASNLLTLNQPAEAEAILRRVLDTLAKEDAGLPWIQNLLAGALAKQGRFADAAEIYRAVIAADAGNVEARVRLGIAELRLGNVGPAIEQLETAATFEPVSLLTLQYLAIALARGGQLDRAQDVFRGAKQRDASLAAPARALAERYALPALSATAPDSVRVEMAQYAVSLGELEGAERLLADPPPRTPLAWLAQAELSLALERPDRAAEAYRAALRLDPRMPAAWRRLAQLLQDVGNTVAARETLEAGRAANAGDAGLTADCVRLLAERPEDAPRAVEIARRALAGAGAPDPDLRLALAAALAAAGDRAAALSVLDALLESLRSGAEPALAERARELRERLRAAPAP